MPLVDTQRKDLLAGVSEVVRPLIDVNSLSNNDLTKLLIYGDERFPDIINKKILELTLHFIHKSGRFD